MQKILVILSILSIINFCAATVCRDGSQCPGTTTCCLTPKGVGCCPYENANCCGDGLHCCPNGYNCDVTGGRCAKGDNLNEFLAFVDTTPAKLSDSQIITPRPNVQLPSMADVMKCLWDIKPVYTDVVIIYKAYMSGDADTIEATLLRLASEGFNLGKDCLKVIEEMKKQN